MRRTLGGTCATDMSGGEDAAAVRKTNSSRRVIMGSRPPLGPTRVERRMSYRARIAQLQVESLAVHPDRDVPAAGPGVEPHSGAERGIVRAHGAGESDCCLEELAASVDHGSAQIAHHTELGE